MAVPRRARTNDGLWTAAPENLHRGPAIGRDESPRILSLDKLKNPCARNPPALA
jgi:hypothetical protein